MKLKDRIADAGFGKVLFLGRNTPDDYEGKQGLASPHPGDFRRLCHPTGVVEEILVAGANVVLACSTDLADSVLLLAARRQTSSLLYTVTHLWPSERMLHFDNARAFPRGSLTVYFRYANSEELLRDDAASAWNFLLEALGAGGSHDPQAALVICAHHVMARMLVLLFAESLGMAGREFVETLMDVDYSTGHAFLWNGSWMEDLPPRIG